MDDLCIELLKEIGYYLPGYQRGFLTGVIVVIVILFIIRIIYLSLRAKVKRCNGVAAGSDKGNMFVSAAAISDLIKALEAEFDGIKFSKTSLYRKRKKYSIKLIADLDNKDVDFPNLINHIREKIFESVNQNLGISCINKVDIVLKRVKSNY